MASFKCFNILAFFCALSFSSINVGHGSSPSSAIATSTCTLPSSAITSIANHSLNPNNLSSIPFLSPPLAGN
ncbi:hypothetical protein SADUNF_Sadunf13G0088900 [Salix dunnii]|uniref:Uncharacterized protein n=1 Tax=Salix dunnii TaxID=1413687 RepID=A0A835JP98_9ROSI|nr:hypothetical protein SADUNF_Sadunf13G0088900 [Salix dunnii]